MPTSWYDIVLVLDANYVDIRLFHCWISTMLILDCFTVDIQFHCWISTMLILDCFTVDIQFHCLMSTMLIWHSFYDGCPLCFSGGCRLCWYDIDPDLFSFAFSDINECSSHPCLNGAICIDRVNDYLCECRPGYADKNCQTGRFL